MVNFEKITGDLHRWLVVREGAGVRVDNLELLSGGFSQFMAAFDLHGVGGVRKLVLRASRPAGESISNTDRLAEWELISALSAHGAAPLPKSLWFDEGAALGAPCFVVEHVPGITLKHSLAGQDATAQRDMVARLCDCLVAIHAVPVTALPVHLARPTGWESHIDGLIDRWVAIERSGLEPDPVVRYIVRWLRANKPAPGPLGLVHGEVNNDNLIVGADGALVAVDWEFGHIGDPREDLGWYRTVSTSVPPDVLGSDIEGFCRRYRELTGLDESVINPEAVSYFGLLASVGVYGSLVGGSAAVESGAQAPVLAAYVSAVLATTQLHWMECIHTLEQSANKKEQSC